MRQRRAQPQDPVVGAAVFALVRDYKLRFAISQLAMLVAAVCIVWYASLISELVDKGMVAGDQETAVNVGIWMLVLAIAMGLSIAIAGSQAVFFSQGAALYIRRELSTRCRAIRSRTSIIDRRAT